MVKLDCEAFRDRLDSFVDGMLPEEMNERMREHMASCEDCREEYELLCQMREELSHLNDDLEVPTDAQRAWRAAVRRDAAGRGKNRIVRVLSCIAAAFVLLAGATVLRTNDLGKLREVAAKDSAPAFVGTSEPAEGIPLSDDTPEGKAVSEAEPPALFIGDEGSALSTEDMSRGETYFAPEEASNVEAVYHFSSEDDLGRVSAGGLLDTQEKSAASKLLRSAELSIRTTDFDADLASIRSALAKVGGVFERTAISGEDGGRKGELVLRVPAGFLDSFVETIRAVATVVSSEVSALDITAQYTDTALQLDTYRAQLARVRELTATAANLDEVLELEQEAARLQYEIDTLTGTLKGWDSRTEMATVHVVMNEYTLAAASFDSQVFSQKVNGQFSDSMNVIGAFLQEMLLTLIALLPYLLWIVPLGIIALIAVRCRRRHA